MADTQLATRPVAVSATAGIPQISVVIPIYNEEHTIREVHRQTVDVLEDLGRPYELILVDDGSSDRTWTIIEELHREDARLRAVRFKRNFGQHPAMHAGLVRAQGEIVVTMDADLQNSPSDLPSLVAAVEAGSDVASGRRLGREDSWGRTVPSRLINGMLRRFTGAEISDFGCAFNAYRRDALTPVLGAIGKQKFTKALVLSTGASVVEVDLEHRARADESRYSPLRLTRLALHVLAGFWPQPIQLAGVVIGTVCAFAGIAVLRLGARELDPERQLPGFALPRRPRARRPRAPGLHPRPRRRVPEPDPARRRGATALHDRARAAGRRVTRKRILVTGGCGFIPSNFIRHLLANTPYDVVSLDALTYAGNTDNLADVMGHERLSFVHGDIRDHDLVREIVSDVDVIVNAAAESHVEKSIAEGASEFVTTNVEGTQILLDAIREAPVERFILISSSEVYGTALADPMDEEHPLNPRSPYAATKAGGDRLAYSYVVTYGLPIVIVRPFNNYGPYQHPEKVIPRFITQALRDEPLTIHGQGRASRDWLFVDDDAEAIERVIEADLDVVAGEVVNVATGIDIGVAEIADLVLAGLGKPSSLKVHVDERPGQVDRHIGSTEKAGRLLGWRARTSFETGLERTISWYADNRAWWESILRSDVFSS